MKTPLYKNLVLPILLMTVTWQLLATDVRKGELIYTNDFASQSDVNDWVMEGPGDVYFENGWMHMYSPNEEYHHVFWCPEDMPDRFIAEWEAQNMEPDAGLCIVFFAAKGVNGEDIFHHSLPKRNGDFTWYIKDKLRSYHISYYANTPIKPDRGTSHLRKNNEFRLVSDGEMGIPTNSVKTHKLKLIKDGPHIRMYVDNRKIIDWLDTPENDNRPHYKEGKFGFRQMQWTHFRYRSFRVWEIEDDSEVLQAMYEIPSIYPATQNPDYGWRFLNWPEPTLGQVAKTNPPMLRWPIEDGKNLRYDVRLARDLDSPGVTTYSAENLPWAL